MYNKSLFSSDIVSIAYEAAEEMIKNNRLQETVSFSVGVQKMWISTDQTKVIGSHSFSIGGHIFYIGILNKNAE